MLICIWSIGWSMDTDFAKISTQYYQSELYIRWRRIKSEKLEKIKLRKKIWLFLAAAGVTWWIRSTQTCSTTWFSFGHSHNHHSLGLSTSFFGVFKLTARPQLAFTMVIWIEFLQSRVVFKILEINVNCNQTVILLKLFGGDIILKFDITPSQYFPIWGKAGNFKYVESWSKLRSPPEIFGIRH